MSDFQIVADSQDALDELFELLVADAEKLENQGITVRATSSGSVQSGAGIPEITNLILAMGTAGVFTALSSVLIVYFRNRNRVVIASTTDGQKKTVTITAENCKPEALAAAFKALK